MTSRVLCAFVLVTVAACKGAGTTTTGNGATSGGTDDTNGSGTSSGTDTSGNTFCALQEITTRTCPDPPRQDHSWSQICEDNIPDCTVLNRAGKNYEEYGCDVDVTYKLSTKNQSGPFPGTCDDYIKWDNGTYDCLETKDCLGYPGVECKNKQCYCGDELWDSNVRAKSLPSVCVDATTVGYPGWKCDAGKIVETVYSTSPCTGGTTCVQKAGDYSSCEGTPPPSGIR